MCGKDCTGGVLHIGPTGPASNTSSPDYLYRPTATTPMPTDLEPTVKHPKFVMPVDTRTPLMKVLEIVDLLDEPARDRLIEALAIYYGYQVGE